MARSAAKQTSVLTVHRYQSYENMIFEKPVHENVVADLITKEGYFVFTLKENDGHSTRELERNKRA